MGSFQDRNIGEHNRVAILELVAREHSWPALRLTQEYLSLPLRKYHLFVIPLVRIPRLFNEDDARRAAAEIVRLFNESIGVQFEPQWQERFTVEVFRTLCEISPSDVVNSIGEHLDKVGDFELTAVLESVCWAAQKSNAMSLSEASLKASALKLWRQYVSDADIVNIGNRPGIMARLIEILGRSGFSVDDLMQEIVHHPLKPQVLYQFVQRPLDFLLIQQRLHLFINTLQHMVDTKQFLAAKRFTRDVFLPTIGPGLEEGIFRRMLSATQEEIR